MDNNFLNMKQIELSFFLLNYLHVIPKLDCSPHSCLRIWHFQWQ